MTNKKPLAKVWDDHGPEIWSAAWRLGILFVSIVGIIEKLK